MNIKKKLKEYIKECNLKNIIFNSVIISLFIFVLDFYDQPSKVIGRDITYGECFIFIHIIIFLIALYFILNSGFKCLTSDDCNPLDNLIFYGLFVSLFTIPTNIFMNHNLCINIEMIIMCLMILGIRILFILIPRNKSIKSNLISLNNLRIGNIPDEGLMLLKEEPLTTSIEDLLDYSKTKDSLKKFITECHTDKSFVLGLVGEWGTGKTSLINMVKEELPNNEIVNFNIWNYKDEQSMFDGLYKLLIKTLGQKVNKIELRKNLNQYKKILFGYIKTRSSIPFDSIVSDYANDLETIKDEINKLIKAYQEEIIIVIDDLDRISKEQILFAIKMIKNIIDFQGIKYILCYDELKIDLILDDEYSKKYIDKVVNVKVRVPEIDKTTFRILFRQIMFNCLEREMIFANSEDDLDEILTLIANDIPNMRSMIRYINSFMINIETLKEYQLNVPDFLALEYIKSENEKLYKHIYNNHAQFLKLDYYIKKELDEFFSGLHISDWQMEIVKYCTARKLSPADKLFQKRCSAPQHFFAYFANKENMFTLINREVEELIEIHNNGEDITDYLEDMLKSPEKSSEYKLILSYNVGLIKRPKDFLDELLKFKSNYIDTIINILEILEKNITKIIPEKFKNKFVILEKIINKTKHQKEYDTIYETCKTLLEENVDELIKLKSDFYRDSIYEKGLDEVIYSIIGQKEFQTYMDNILNEKNIMRFMSNLVIVEESTKTRIKFDNKEAQNTVSKEKFDEVVNHIDGRKLNREEKIILRAYKEGLVILKDYEELDFNKIRYIDTSKKEKNLNKKDFSSSTYNIYRR